MGKKIKEFGKVIDALTELTIKIGTLVAIIKMVVESIRQNTRGEQSPHIKYITCPS